MRKLSLIFTFILFSTLAYAGPNDKINESGFINKEVRLIKNFEIKDPKNKIILIIITDKTKMIPHQIVHGYQC